jgi:CBS domain containing-hemolysin-like protein
MPWLWVIVAILVALGSVLAMAEASLSRTTRVQAMTLQGVGRRNADVLALIEDDPASYLNAIYLCVMFIQNGSAIFVAVLAEQTFGEIWVTGLSVAFTIAYFVVVEAMSKTFGILHSASVALALAPAVWILGRVLRLPTRALIGLANILLPGKGLREGPFVTPEEIRSMAEIGHEEGTVDEQERSIIQSLFGFQNTLVREVMVPRPDVITVQATNSLREVLDLMLATGHWRLPVYREEPADIRGILYAEDVLRRLETSDPESSAAQVMRPPLVVPETKRAADLLKEMQSDRIHVAIAVNEYGSTTGLITMDDILEELVGDIGDEYDEPGPSIEILGNGAYRFAGGVPIRELGETFGTQVPEVESDTVGGLVYDLLGRVPEEGETVPCAGLRITVEQMQRRRVVSLIIELEGD